ncbi:hypothetical protein [Methylobacter sp.]|uniref:hypothetical protein n=1 Tax=Methylobacter sp. TaxID=2051955 RepID=UPI0025D09AE8|nr:hypothetical protein [Methylobacter sp.]
MPRPKGKQLHVFNLEPAKVPDALRKEDAVAAMDAKRKGEQPVTKKRFEKDVQPS